MHTTESAPLRTGPESLRHDTDRILSEIAAGRAGGDPFAAAVVATRMPMIVTDPRKPDNPIIFANDAFRDLTGYTREEIVGRNCRFLQGPETNPEDVSRIREAVAAGRRIEIAICNYRKDGTPFWNQLLVAPVRDEAGGVIYFVASQYDITSDFAQLAALRGENAALIAQHAASAERLRIADATLPLATEAAEIGLWDIDPVANTLSWPPRVKAMFGLSPDVPVTMADFEAGLHPEDRATTRAALDAARDPASRAIFEVEYRAIGREDGVVRWVAAKGRGLFDEAGRACAWSARPSTSPRASRPRSPCARARRASATWPTTRR